MFVLACAVLATPLMAAALDALLVPPMGALAALLAPLQTQTSGLHPQQLTVPPACVQVCEVFVTAINDCPTAACACTAQNMNEGLDCIECTGDWVDGQATLNQFALDCQEYVVNPSVPTLSGRAPQNGDAVTYKSSPKKTPTPPQSSGNHGTPGAIRVGNRAGVLCVLFSVCLTVVLVV